jgi:hypothetical protein
MHGGLLGAGQLKVSLWEIEPRLRGCELTFFSLNVNEALMERPSDWDLDQAERQIEMLCVELTEIISFLKRLSDPEDLGASLPQWLRDEVLEVRLGRSATRHLEAINAKSILVAFWKLDQEETEVRH